MGHEIEALALSMNYEIVAVIDNESDWNTYSDLFQTAETALEFTTPETAPDNILRCFQNQIPVVSGSTGWMTRWEEIVKACRNCNATFMYSSNYSIGMNIFFYLNRKAAAVMDRFREYDISMEEIHHAQKLDKPSGTAIKLAEDILRLNKGKKQWTKQDPEKTDELAIKSIREGQFTGTHIVKYTSAEDEIMLQHMAFNRKGFASGALTAASWIKDKKGLFTMNDMLGFE